MKSIRTQVGIVGAGPSGLMLGHLLHLAGIDSVIVEKHSQDYVIERVRAGVLEQSSVDLMIENGVGERLLREGMPHDGIYINVFGERHRIDMAELTGRRITVYGQNEVVRDLVAARESTHRPLIYEVSDVRVDAIDSDRPRIRFTSDEESYEVECDFIAGCDGFHGICRETIPQQHLQIYERVYPFGWLGVLADAAPSSPELVYSRHENGFALFSMRSETVTRLYLQCEPDEDLDQWSDDRIWDELRTRLRGNDGWEPRVGPITQKGVTPMRSFVTEPMRYGRMFLAGDAAHIVPPTGAKGMNLAINDARLLAEALTAWYGSGDEAPLDAYSETCLRRVWRVQEFSVWMTWMLHRIPDGLPDAAFRRKLQRAQLEYVTSGRTARSAAVLAENYIGIEDF